MNQIWALVPVKNFAFAKSRLASVLSTEDRHALALAMTLDVATALKRSRTVARVVMVSDIPALNRLIGMDGIKHFDTRRARGLNEDLASAASWAGAQGATHVLIVHADLPRLTPQAIDRFVTEGGDASASLMRAAACKQGSGTNLLLASVPLPLPLVFGKNSLARFYRAAAATDVVVEVIHDTSLAGDIDEPDDFRALLLAYTRGELAGRATADFLRAAAAAHLQEGTDFPLRKGQSKVNLLCHATEIEKRARPQSIQ